MAHISNQARRREAKRGECVSTISYALRQQWLIVALSVAVVMPLTLRMRDAQQKTKKKTERQRRTLRRGAMAI